MSNKLAYIEASAEVYVGGEETVTCYRAKDRALSSRRRGGRSRGSLRGGEGLELFNYLSAEIDRESNRVAFHGRSKGRR